MMDADEALKAPRGTAAAVRGAPGSCWSSPQRRDGRCQKPTMAHPSRCCAGVRRPQHTADPKAAQEGSAGRRCSVLPHALPARGSDRRLCVPHVPVLRGPGCAGHPAGGNPLHLHRRKKNIGSHFQKKWHTSLLMCVTCPPKQSKLSISTKVTHAIMLLKAEDLRRAGPRCSKATVPGAPWPSAAKAPTLPEDVSFTAR